jgi:hypothetical protein
MSSFGLDEISGELGRFFSMVLRGEPPTDPAHPNLKRVGMNHLSRLDKGAILRQRPKALQSPAVAGGRIGGCHHISEETKREPRTQVRVPAFGLCSPMQGDCTASPYRVRADTGSRKESIDVFV